MDLHYGLNWSILYDFSHNFSFIGRDSVWRRTLVNPVGFLEAVGTWLCGMPFSPPIWSTCHSTDIIGSVLVLEKWVACMRYQSTFSQEPPGPIYASTVASVTILGTTRDQILRREIGCVSTLGLNCNSVSCHTCGGKSPGCSTVFLIQWTMSPSRPLIRSNEDLRKISSGRKRSLLGLKAVGKEALLFLRGRMTCNQDSNQRCPAHRSCHSNTVHWPHRTEWHRCHL